MRVEGDGAGSGGHVEQRLALAEYKVLQGVNVSKRRRGDGTEYDREPKKGKEYEKAPKK